MKLTPMRYKDYTWPHNPETCRVEMERKVAAQKVPFGGYVLQDLGVAHRVMRGEGVFAGEGAYEEFRELVQVFEEDGAGMLVHPVWQAMRAHFTALEVLEEPRPDFVRYTFEFWEDGGRTGLTLLAEAPDTEPPEDAPEAGATVSSAEYHTVVKGDTLWGIGKRYGVTLANLIRLNPQIKNPNLIYPGNEVKLR